MYIIVAGGGKVGFYLARELIAQGHEVLLIEKSSTRCAQIAAELGNVVQRGNADEATVLAEAGTNRAGVMVAVTGDDEDNLVICQVAKRRFNVPRVITVLVVWDIVWILPLPLGVAGHEGSTMVVGLNGLRLLRRSAWEKADQGFR